MRYEQQVVLQMPPGSAGSNESGAPGSNAVTSGDSNELKAASPVTQDGVAAPVVKAVPKVGDKKPAGKAPAVHGGAKKSAPKAKPHAAVAKHNPVVTKHPAGTTQHHPTQVAHP
jgi:hypothetical protein